MFRQFARLPLRRALHSQAGPSYSRYTRSTYALGASVAIAGYLAWSSSRHIWLDSETPPHKKQPSSPNSAIPRSSDASLPSDALESTTVSAEGAESSPVSSEAPVDGESVEGESSGGAYNPETGEINWDCPCLGGMAHGPCGQQFRDAFSCFVHSEADPKGIDCVEKFKAMQECFREHPDVYGDEIMDDDDDEPAAEPATSEKTGGDSLPSDSSPQEPARLSTPASS